MHSLCPLKSTSLKCYVCVIWEMMRAVCNEVAETKFLMSLPERKELCFIMLALAHLLCSER